MLSYNLSPDIYKSDAEDIIRLFFPSYSVSDDDKDNAITQTVTVEGNKIFNLITLRIQSKTAKYCYENSFNPDWDNVQYKRQYKRFLKHSLYLSLKNFLGVSMPWGSLTGIRPTRIAYGYLERGFKVDDVQALMIKDYDVSPDKAALIKDILIAQEGIYNIAPGQLILYINIPVCKTRCNYCSFISSVYSKCEHLLDHYTRLLLGEINYCIDKARAQGLKIKSVYIGGGTPTVLGKERLALVLKAVNNIAGLGEWTVEAGRPDSIDKEILDLLKENNVTRISINPQSFNDKTLRNIGRAHSPEDIFKAYEMAKPYGFTINMDLIAGLTGETFEEFAASIDKAIGLKPHNITVHTLSIKGGSKLKEQGTRNLNDQVPAMLEYAKNQLYQSGYTPYYLYRQKYTMGNAENTGWTLPGSRCAYNIYAMEEIASVAAAGAGAISKLFVPGGKFARFANFKNIEDYIQRYDEVLKDKENFFKALGKR